MSAFALLVACGGGGSAIRSAPSVVLPPPTAPPVNATPAPTGQSPPHIGGCSIFPADNSWNQDISRFPVDPKSSAYLASMNASTTNLHPDFGSDPTYGIPFVVVPPTQPLVSLQFLYADQSDPGPYPIPANAPIEYGNDHHILVVQSGTCMLYELYHATFIGPGWDADSGAIFNLNSDALRPDYWTSADAAGLPILPGLARFDEVQSGVITHALRFTVQATQNGFIHPATHFADANADPNLPPMGLRVRLKASYDISSFTGESLVILTALKKYGMFVADDGADWYISGTTDARWNANDLNQLLTVPGSAFEVVQTGPIIH